MEDSFWNELDRYALAKGKGWAEVVRDWLAIAAPSDNRSASIKETILHLLRKEVDLLQTGSCIIKATWQLIRPRVKGAISIQTSGARLIVGRESPADLVVADSEVSRRHSMLVNDDERWWLIDLKSKNGTFLAGKQVAVSEIKPGDIFGIGESKIKLISSN
jgi:hypothetical protein